MSKTFRIATFNLRNITDHYNKRIRLIKNEISKIDCDIIGLQEVSFLSSKYDQLYDLNDSNNSYFFLNAQSQLNYKELNKIVDPEFNIDGNSFMIKKDFKICENSNDILHLSPVRCCHKISFYINKHKFNVINLHLHHLVGKDEDIIRHHSIDMILKWIDLTTSPEDTQIILGDFNTPPNSLTYNFLIKNNYKSIYLEKNKEEPKETFHGKLIAPYADNDFPLTCDFIL